MAEPNQNVELKWELLVADAWADDGLMKRLIADPALVLKERGISVPAGVTVKIAQNEDKVWHMVIPPKPELAELSDEQLEAVAGGQGCIGITIGSCRTGGGCGGCGGSRASSGSRASGGSAGGSGHCGS